MLQDSKAKITSLQNWGDYFVLAVETPKIAAEARPGQFLMVRVNDPSWPLLRRPFSIHAREGSRIEIFFQVVGRGTAALARKGQGEALDILGPLGKGFDLDRDLKGKPTFLVGGGRGIAPLYFLGRELGDLGAEVTVLYGGKCVTDLPAREKFEAAGLKIVCSTDDGTFGFRGLATRLLEFEMGKGAPAAVFACGPEAMLKKTSEIARAHSIPAQLSLESMMGCGFGACWGCVKRIRKDGEGKWRKICEDGPVFRAEDVVWEEGD